MAVPGAEPRVLVARRSTYGDRAELELVRAADGTSVWKHPLPHLAPDARALAASEKAIVAILDESSKGEEIVALDPATGAERWRTRLERAYRAWIHDDVVVVQPLSTSEVSLHGLDLSTGKKRWESPPVASHYAPVFVGRHLVVPTRHAHWPPLAVVDVNAGTAHTVGCGLAWPGVARGDGYVTTFWPGQEGEAMVTTALVADAAARDAARSAPTPKGGSEPLLTTLLPNSGGVSSTRVLPSHARRHHRSSLRSTRIGSSSTRRSRRSSSLGMRTPSRARS